MIKNIVIAATLMFGVHAQAGFVFNPSVFYFHQAEKQGASESESTIQLINLKFGYAAPSGLYLGAAYDMESRKYGSSAADEDRNSLGATIGYVSGGWQFLGTYFLSSEFEQMDGTGYSIEIGYVFQVGSVGIGPLLSYRQWEYDENNGVAMANKQEQTNIWPSIQFQYAF